MFTSLRNQKLHQISQLKVFVLLSLKFNRKKQKRTKKKLKNSKYILHNNLERFNEYASSQIISFAFSKGRD